MTRILLAVAGILSFAAFMVVAASITAIGYPAWLGYFVALVILVPPYLMLLVLVSVWARNRKIITDFIQERPGRWFIEILRTMPKFLLGLLMAFAKKLAEPVLTAALALGFILAEFWGFHYLQTLQGITTGGTPSYYAGQVLAFGGIAAFAAAFVVKITTAIVRRVAAGVWTFRSVGYVAVGAALMSFLFFGMERALAGLGIFRAALVMTVAFLVAVFFVVWVIERRVGTQKGGAPNA